MHCTIKSPLEQLLSEQKLGRKTDVGGGTVAIGVITVLKIFVASSIGMQVSHLYFYRKFNAGAGMKSIKMAE
jgi:hypothetical protein